ncbi:amino acid transporter [Plectosphaerella cucumerina]|uniref:Amino acid transporter n=1 Tax=Plectosphaerella cucumerina TaxID=40658 RepID=A0A8K0TCC2_9PEZI|nr:amino acid transporter [Plectosphaerella cucumerina]
MSQYQSKSEEIHPVQAPVDDDVSKDDSSLKVIESHVLQERTIGIFGGVSLIVNKIIGSGIFSTPSTILRLAGSPGMALMCWVIGGIIATAGTIVFLEFGTAIPRSGGVKNYLERSFSPRLMQTCIYIFYCVFLQVSASNAITFSSYILVSAGVPSTTWLLRGIAIASAVFSVAIHTVAPRWGRGLQDALAAVKLFVLFFIICCGFAALNGKLRIEKPDNFANAFAGTTNNGYNIGTAILNVIFSFGGYDNVNAVLSEVRNPQRTLRVALPLAMGIISVLYILANIAYLAAVPKADFLTSNVTVAATLFKNMFGDTAGTKVLPVLVALSALGHLLGVAFTVPRLIQELAKDGVLPFSDFMMENRPFKTPIFALVLHLGVTILFICAPPAGDAFNFIVSLSSYPTTVLYLALTVGLIKLRLTKKEAWSAPFTAPWFAIIIYLLGNIFLTVMPFVRPPNGKGNTSLPYWLSSVVALAILSLGIVYYTLRFVLAPRVFGYRHTTLQKELSDGSTVTRFRRIKNA